MGFTAQNFRISTHSIFIPYVAEGVTELRAISVLQPPYTIIPQRLAEHSV